MSDFEFIFALFGLLLGLSLAEVLGGLARAIEARLRLGSAIRIGWLTPLLGAFVMLDLLSFWQAAWTVRDVVGVSGKSLMAITLFASAYYLAAHLVFPRAIEGQPDFDAHFFRVRRIVIGVMFGLLLCQLAWYANLPALAPHLLRPLSLGLTAVLALLMAGAMFVRGARGARLVMLALVARYILIYLLQLRGAGTMGARMPCSPKPALRVETPSKSGSASTSERRMRILFAVLAPFLIATAAPQEPATVRVRIVTSAGNITLALDAKRAPKTVANFMAYVDDGRLDGTQFYRSARRKGAPGQGFVQGGIGTDARRMLPSVLLEPTSQTGIRHLDATVSMAHGPNPDGANCNFSIMVGPNPGLDARGAYRGFAAFGKVISGMEVVKRILALPTGGGRDAMKDQMILQPVRILRVERLDGAARPTGYAKPWLIGPASRQFPVPGKSGLAPGHKSEKYIPPIRFDRPGPLL